jgi:predicted DCC family thiol-disulfide oxidoreductase YuxK
LALLGFVMLAAAMSQSGASWLDGSALYYALHTDRWTSALGVLEREAMPPAALALCSRVFRYAEFAVPLLLFVPVARRLTRGLAAAALLFIGLCVAALFTFGAYGWTLAAAAALVIPTESWARCRDGGRPLRVVYDDSCGICLWLARLLKRLDRRDNITFIASSDTHKLPAAVTSEMTEKSMVVVDAAGKAHTEASALSQILRSLPLLGPLGRLLRVPPIRQLARVLYFKVADNRVAISVACGLGACGLPSPLDTAPEDTAPEDTAPEDTAPEDTAPAPADEAPPAASPASRFGQRCASLLASLVAVAILGGVVVKTARHPHHPWLAIGTEPSTVSDALASLVTLPRVTGAWGLFAPDPPKINSAIVVDGKTRDGWQLDPLTGHAPNLDLTDPRRARLGHLWAQYSEAIRKPQYASLRKELRRYLNRGGYALNVNPPKDRKKRRYISKVAVKWVSVAIPAPGEAAPATRKVERENLLNPGSPSRPRRLGPSKMPGLRQLRR